VAKKSSKKTGNALKEAAREIGSRLGEAKVRASRVVEGVKAAVKAGTDTYKGKAKNKKKKPAGTRKSSK
jgi:hypothetical protein